MHIKKQEVQVPYAIILSVFAASSYYSYHVSMILLLISLFFINRFGFLEYMAFSLMPIMRAQTELVLSMGDIKNYYEMYVYYIYNNVGFSGYFGHDLFFDYYIKSIAYVLGEMSYERFVAVLMILFLMGLMPLVMLEKRTPLVAGSIIIFLDSILVLHLYRQMFSNLLILYSFVLLFHYKSHLKSGLFFLFSIFLHGSSLILGFAGYVLSSLSPRFLKISMALSALVGILVLDAGNFSNFLLLVTDYGFAASDRLDYIVRISSPGEASFRAQFVLAAALSFFVSKNNLLFKIFLIYASLALIFFSVSALSTRVGLISSSLLTGIPIGLFLNTVRSSVLKHHSCFLTVR